MMRIIKTANYITALSMLVFASFATAGRITDSKHDFSSENWTLYEQICVLCHAPHALIDDYGAKAPLWNHTETTASFSMYWSPTFDGAGGGSIGAPDGTSILCLSCHDGTVALDSFGGKPGNEYLNSGDAGYIGTDLSNDHPISFDYSDSLADIDGGLRYPTTEMVTIGEGKDSKIGTISEVMLFDGKLQCATCHDVHNKYTISSSKLLKVSTDNSKLCFVCHDK